MFSQIIAGTPKWVFVVFFVLLFYGYTQSRTRQAPKIPVVILPAVMILLSIGGVLSSFGVRPDAMLAWVAGVAAAVGLNQVIGAPAGVSYDPASRRFHLPGSWTPLALMMVIYFAKYVVGVTLAMQPAAAATTWFVTLLSFLLGGCSGTFFARFLRIWATQRLAILVPPAAVETNPNWRAAK